MVWIRKKTTILCNLSADTQRKKRSQSARKVNNNKNSKSLTSDERSKILKKWRDSWF